VTDPIAAVETPERAGATGTTTSEVGELGRAAASLLDVVAETVEQTHAGIAGRAFDAVGPLGRGVRVVHDTVAGLAYRAVRGGVRGTGTVVGTIADTHPGLRARRPLATARGERLLAAVSGIVGDRLAADHPLLDVGLGLRHDGMVVGPGQLAEVHPDPGPDLVVFLHGLCESDRSWWRPSRAHRAAERMGDTSGAAVVTHGERLAEAHGMTPLYVRYNTGRRIHHNGRRLALLLEDLVDAWPVGVRRLALVGHSMGGLVLRSACYQAEESGLGWPGLVDDLVYLGTPHLGAPLARGVDAASTALSWLPETRGLTGLLSHRSEGVRDLVRGDIVEGVVADEEPAAALRDAAGDPPALAGARHHLLAATVTADPGHPFGRLVGDVMVRSASGSGRSRRRDLGLGDDVVIQGGIDHFDLLSHPRVGEQIVTWLAPTG
jgi:pimeloyl-ACP methyl ester carboxylesterase